MEPSPLIKRGLSFQNLHKKGGSDFSNRKGGVGKIGELKKEVI